MPPAALVALVALAVFLLNMPFGYWRQGVRKFSWRWFLAIHVPVPAVVGLRLWAGLSWHFIPVFVVAFFAGQRLGAALRQRRTG